MPLAAGQRLGSYEILALIGAGGMGEVYRARDTRLERTVAIKVLPEHVAADPDLKHRFEREAKAISSLNHPHICTLYDVGSENGVEYLVMECLEGETLTLRLLKGAIPFPLVLRYAVEIAEALDRAHRQGITHRDLKPGNVMLTKAGAKLLDFGLAKLNPAAPVQVSSVATASPDLLTASGTILGTLQYMAPEQLEGKPVDHRADIFALGAIVYEMATGNKAFEGDSQARLIGAILKDEPGPVSTLQPLSPPVFDALIATCLAKDPDDRWQSAGDIGRQLRLLQSSSSQPSLLMSSPALAAPTSARPRGWRGALPYALTAVASAAVGAAALYGVMRPAPREPPPVTRFVITPPADAPLADVEGYDVAISPDGRRIAYVARTGRGDGTAIYLRDLDGLEARAVPGTETSAVPVSGPFFSADGRSLVFQSSAKLMRVALDGGPPLAIADLPGGSFNGGVWTADGTVIFANGTALYRVSAGGGGGSPEQLTPNVAVLVAPSLLPDARGVLSGIVEDQNDRVAVLDLASRTKHVVAKGGLDGVYSSGYLIFALGTTLMAQPFDPKRSDVTGEPVAVLQGVRHTHGAADFALGANGTLVYVPTTADLSARSALVWVDRSGRVVARAVDDLIENPFHLRLSPEGRRIALTAGTPFASELWVHYLDGRPPVLLASGGSNGFGVWNPDGKTIAFSANRDNGAVAIYTLPADGSGRDPQLAQRLGALPAAWMSTGDVIAWRFDTGGQGDIVAARVDGQGDVRNVVATPDAERFPSLSPDERWLAYVTNRTGVPEVWVKRYPDGAPVRVSRSGGLEPVWSRDGRELFYRRDDAMLAVAVAAEQTAETLSFEAPVELFKEPSYFRSSAPIVRSYDVAPDGRFLMIQPEGGANRPVESDNIVVIENWIEEVKRRVPLH
jgi:Tol biopolymer transport system component